MPRRSCAAVAVLLLLSGAIIAQPVNRNEISAILFLPDGKRVVSAAMTGQVRLWDGVSGNQIESAEVHKDGVHGLALAPDGAVIAAACNDGHIRFLDAKTLKELKSLEAGRGEIIAVAFSPDGKLLASGGADKTIRIWDLKTGKEVRHWHGHEQRVTSLAFAPDGKTVASGGTAAAVVQGFFADVVHGDEAKLWDVSSGKEVRKLGFRATAVAFAPDGQTVIGGGMEVVGMQVGGGTTIRGGSKVEVRKVTGEAGALSAKGTGLALALTADGRHVATAWGSRRYLGRIFFENEVKHRQVALLEVASGRELLQLSEQMATAVAVSPDGVRIAFGRTNGTVGFHDLKPKGVTAAKAEVDEVDRLWKILGGDNAPAAYEAVWSLIDAGDGVVPLLKKKLRPVPRAGERVAELLKKLDDKRFAVREAAFRELKKLGSAIEPELRQALKGQPSPEVRRRVGGLLEEHGKHPANAEEFAQLRALVVFERVGGKEARAALAWLAEEGSPGAWLTEEARASRQRLVFRHRRVEE